MKIQFNQNYIFNNSIFLCESIKHFNGFKSRFILKNINL